MSDRPDIVIVMTDEERAIPPYEADDVRAWRNRVLTPLVRRARGRLRPALHRFAGLRAQPADDVHRAISRSARGHPDRRDRQERGGSVDALAAPRGGAHARKLVPRSRLRHPLRRQVAHLARRSHRSATGRPPATNDDDGVVDPAAVRRYLDADPLDPYGFSGWVGPEPHGAGLANSGMRRDPLITERVVAWLTDRHARRRAGDPDALRPFLLVASFVNPHDIVLFPTVAAPR